MTQDTVMLSKRLSGGVKEENYEHVLMCLICRSLFDDYDHQPKFLPCHHTFCKDCLREYVKQAGDEIECPSCRKTATIPTAGVVALQTNFYVKYIQSLVYGSSGVEGGNGALECDLHIHNKLLYYCKDCSRSICEKCCSSDGKSQNQCVGHKKVPLTAFTEEHHQKLDSAFAKTNSIIEHKKVELEAMMKALSEEKDQAMKKIDSTFEQHVHTLTRRSTLLKNKVIAIYNEYMEKLEGDLEEISTAMTCIVSLKEYHENMIGNGHFMDVHKGISEMEEVYVNIHGRIQAKENHIVFEEKHGTEKFRGSAKDLGRVRTSRPTYPRASPEGNDAAICPDTSQMSQHTLGNQAEGNFSLAGGGAVGGAAAPPESYDMMGAVSSMDSQQHSCHDNTTDMRDASSSILNKCDKSITNHGNTSQTSNSHTNSALLENDTSKLDINSNTPITVPGVVRPKTLPNNSSQMSTSMSNKKSLDNKRGIKSSSQKTGGVVPSLLRSDPGPDMFSLRVDKPDLAGLREIEHLKQTDKMYHHLVYTSYDEEELLKELKCGKAHLDSTPPGAPPGAPPSGHRPTKNRSMEDSDSWMTVSSESTLSGNSDDLTISDDSTLTGDQSRL